MNKLLLSIRGDSDNSQHRVFTPSISIDNSDDYIRLPANLNQVSGKRIRHNTAWTFEAYFSANTFSIGSIYDTSNPYGYTQSQFNLGWQLLFWNGIQRVFFAGHPLGVENTFYFQTSMPLKPTLNHVVVSCDGSGVIGAVKMYINGFKVPISLVTLFYNTVTNVSGYELNLYNTLGVYFTNVAFRQNGKIARCKMFSRAVSDTEARAWYNETLSPLGDVFDYNISASSGTNFPDISGNSLNGTIFGQGSTPSLSNFYI